MYRQVAGAARDQPHRACERHRTQYLEFIGIGSREPHFIPVRRPGQSLFAVPLTRERLLLAAAVDNRHPPAVVPLDLVIHECHQVAVWRHARVTDIPARFVQHAPYRIFESVASVHPARHCELGAVRRPVRLLHVFEDFARSAAGDRDPRQRAAAAACAEIVRAEQNRHLTR